ncbi:hypothetical protein ILUMI_27061 [Ignelater luminosus]|uniref:Uncharacterized protein n=1 Tax=Ignelater luminosus TaxID=2038154 RepID=A0A8K0C3T3_IGNLU|nr:hypothetical protein ILUMI_27061 [Ignelater luminosus]
MCLRSVFMFSLINAFYIHQFHQLENDQVEDYYWADYKGIIPEDALSAGYIPANETTYYIAEVLHKNSLVPGEIHDSDKKAYYEWANERLEATGNVKIFCTKRPQMFQWIQTTNEDFKTLIEGNLVLGKYESDTRIYIGRKQIANNVVIGKVHVVLPDLKGIFYYLFGEDVFFSYSFEVLSYLQDNL